MKMLAKIAPILFCLSCITHIFAQTGISDNFNDGMLAETWKSTPKYDIQEVNNRLKIGINAGLAQDNLSLNVPAIDLSSNAKISLRIKSGADCKLKIELTDIAGNITNLSPVEIDIKGDNITTPFEFDFAGKFKQAKPKIADVDSKKISKITFYFQPVEADLMGIIYFDDLVIGVGGPTNGDPNPYPLSSNIRLNQLGFYPALPKIAIVKDPKNPSFKIATLPNYQVVYTGTLSAAQKWEYSEENVSIADFSAFTTEGNYILLIDSMGRSLPFSIKNKVHHTLNKAAIKGYYYQRTAMDLEEKYAGVWKRPMGHPDDKVMVHASAASELRPTGTIISSSKGWYDAGDYGKYIVNSGISTYSLLALYEHFSAHYDTINLNIPESKNAIPDLLDETLWNLRWMLTMQEPKEGFVYHKLTAANFEGKVMPHQHSDQRMVIGKGAPAALDFAAVMATASRIFKKYDKQLPGFADSCLAASLKAWKWARKNPNVLFEKNPEGVVTGQYEDKFSSDEFVWAANELYITTKQDSFYFAVPLLKSYSVPSWPNVAYLGIMSLAHHKKNLTSKADTNYIKEQIIKVAGAYRKEANSNSPYRVSIGASFDFVWGSNAVIGNQAIVLLQAYKLTGDKTYLTAAISDLDYWLGRNATTYSFVTGFGGFSAMNPHHRPSAADNITAPVPGLLVGGPQNENNPEQGCSFPSELPATKYRDNWCSYSTNEIAINWNAPLVYVTGAIEALVQQLNK